MLRPRYSTALPDYYFGAERSTATLGRSPSAPRTAIAALLTPADVLLGVDASTKERAFEEIARFIAGRHGLPEAEVHARLVDREKIGSTGLGFGIAIPHARIKGLGRPIATFVRTKFPIPFGAPDDKPVSDMLVLLVPPELADEHLHLLAEVAEMFADRNLRENLRTRAEAAAVHALIAGPARV
jgi:PTS system nitrogen regulatory IIA component